MSVFEKQRAFTFIELLIVVTIISLMSAVLIVDFRTARQGQELSTSVEQGLALLQQSQLEVRNGLVDLEVDDEEESLLQTWQCRGAFFSMGTLPLYAQADFVLEDESCDDPEMESYGIGTENVGIRALRVDSMPYESVLVLFEPPNGEPVLWGRDDEDAEFQSLNGDVYMSYGHHSNDELRTGLLVDYLTSSVRILPSKEANEYED